MQEQEESQESEGNNYYSEDFNENNSDTNYISDDYLEET